MKRKLYVKFLILLLCSMLVACSNSNETVSGAKESEKKEVEQQRSEEIEETEKLDEAEIDRIVSEKEEQLRSEGQFGEDQLAVVNFFGHAVPQILTINEENSRSVVRVYYYYEEQKDWSVLYEKSDHDSFDGLERLQILETGQLKENSKLEHAIIGLVSGSGGYLNFFVLGSDASQIVTLADRMSLHAAAGDVEINGTEIVVKSNGQVIETFKIGDQMNVSDESTDLASNDPTITEEKKENNKYDHKDWKTRLQEIAQLNMTNMDKSYELGAFLRDEYTPTEKEVHQYEKDIIEEYTTGRYLSDVGNEVYMLTNMFKSDIVEQYYSNDKENPIYGFAHKFKGNTWSVYVGIDAVGSETNLHTEKYMDSYLEDMEST